jgi:4-carboxymuconolactone decarboxylase
MTRSRWPLSLLILSSVFAGGFIFRGALAQQSPAVMANGLYPDSFTRVPLPKKEDLKTDEERQAFDKVAGPNGIQPGPVGANTLRLYFPIVADRYRDVVRYLRERSGLDPKLAELAILVATRESSGQYEWNAHEPSALKAGISPQTVDIVRNKKDTKGVPGQEEIVIRFGREMLRDPKVSAKTFADAERILGRKNTLAVAMLVTHYSASSVLLHTYDAHLRPDQKQPFPIPY